MQFRLIYHGPLKAEGRNDGRAKEKHVIRKAIQPQLAALWNTHPFLKRFMQAQVISQRLNVEATGSTIEELNKKLVITEYDTHSVAQNIATKFAHKGYNFLPLVGPLFGQETACALDILFLRRDDPGSLIKSGGDVDNRIKVLFDALKMPKIGEFEPPCPPSADEDPFFCLLQDDSLITEIKVTTDRLLEPLGDQEHINDVHLVIHVRTILISSSGDNGGAASAFAT